MDISTKINIAIADDHHMVRQGLMSLIHATDSRFSVMLDAGHGKELLDKISMATYLPDVCLIDLNMPVMDGYETIVEIKKHWPQISIIVLSLYEDNYPILKALKCGATGYLSKSLSADALKEAIVDVYYKEYYFSPLVTKHFPKMNRKNIQEYTKKMLSDKEVQFLSLCCTDMTYEEIGAKMNLSSRTTEKYCAKLKEDLGIHSRAGLVMYALYVGIGRYGITHHNADAP
jgi:two-component system, NarL family, invasion response regulator UvrY